MATTSRRAFLGHLGATAAVPAFKSLSLEAGELRQDSSSETTFDLLITGGRVIDPGQNLSAIRDVAIRHGRIASIGEKLPHAQARQVFDAADKIAILSGLAFGGPIERSAIPTAGISALQSRDVDYATQLDYGVKLLAVAERVDSPNTNTADSNTSLPWR